MVNNHGFIIRKTNPYKKGKRHDYDVYKKNYPLILKQFVNVFDLGYLGVENDYQEQLSTLPCKKNRKCRYLRSRKNTTKIILKRD